MGLIRLDKFLAQNLSMTRSEVKKYLRAGLVTVDGGICRSSEQKIEPEREQIRCQNRLVSEQPETVWLMLHKPAGCVTATEDRHSKTVMDYIVHPRRAELFPVGRLDRDTEGLLFLTNDGETAHRMLSPRHHVDKTYFVRVRGNLTREDVRAFEEGIDIGDDKITLPAELRILRSGQEKSGNPAQLAGGFTCEAAEKADEPVWETALGRNPSPLSEAEVTIREGRFHQVKRMFAVRGCSVIFLKRIRMCGLSLDERLAPGEYRELTGEEIERMQAVCWNRQKL